MGVLPSKRTTGRTFFRPLLLFSYRSQPSPICGTLALTCKCGTQSYAFHFNILPVAQDCSLNNSSSQTAAHSSIVTAKLKVRRSVDYAEAMSFGQIKHKIAARGATDKHLLVRWNDHRCATLNARANRKNDRHHNLAVQIRSKSTEQRPYQ